MHQSWVWRKWRLNSDQHSCAPLSSRALAHGIPPSSSLKRPELALLRSKDLILLMVLIPPPKILNSIISWSLQPSLPPTFTFSTSSSLFFSTRSSRAPLLARSSTTCISKLSLTLCRNLQDCMCLVFPADVRVIEVPHENQGLWLWGWFQLLVEGLIYFLFLVRWPVVHMHNNVTLMSLSLNSNPQALNSFFIRPQDRAQCISVASSNTEQLHCLDLLVCLSKFCSAVRAAHTLRRDTLLPSLRKMYSGIADSAQQMNL